MPVLDRHGVLADLAGHVPAILELGCGEKRKRKDALGVDHRDLPGVDLVGDVFDVLAEFPDASVSEIVSSHFLEHVGDFPRLLSEMARVVRPAGVVESVVPHFSNPYYYSDATHVRPFGLYTFSYFAHDHLLRRRVPHYAEAVPFDLESIHLEFRSPSVFPIRRWFRRGVTPIVNYSVWTQEFYEENLCYLIPCYELKVVLRRGNS